MKFLLRNGIVVLIFLAKMTISECAMKRLIITSAIISAFVVLSSCEQHDWEDTKRLHVDKVDHSDGHGDADKDHAAH